VHFRCRASCEALSMIDFICTARLLKRQDKLRDVIRRSILVLFPAVMAEPFVRLLDSDARVIASPSTVYRHRFYFDAAFSQTFWSRHRSLQVGPADRGLTAVYCWADSSPQGQQRLFCVAASWVLVFPLHLRLQSVSAYTSPKVRRDSSRVRVPVGP
jgi:hypothetical protein